MPTRTSRPLGLEGQGDLAAIPAMLGDQWQDSDKVLVTPRGEVRAWPGFNRRGMRFADTDLHGVASNVFQVMVASERYLRKKNGRVLAIVDRAVGTDGRIVALAHNEGAGLGTQFVSLPIQAVGTGLSDLETRGVFTGSSSAIMQVVIDGDGTPDTFKWSHDNGLTFQDDTVDITGDWQTLENGIEIKFGATTGHTDLDAWIFTVGGRPSLAGTMTRVGPHDYPWIKGGADGKVMMGHGYSVPLVDDGTRVREAGLRAPHIKPVASSMTLNTNDVGRTDANSLEWVAQAEGVVVTRGTSNPDPADGTAYIIIDPSAAQLSEIDLAYVDVSGSLGSDTKRVRFWLRFESDHASAKEHFSLVFCAAAGLAGERVELIVPDSISGRQWNLIDLKYDGATFAYQSIGFRFKKTTLNAATMFLDGILLIDDTDVPISSLFQGPGGWRFVFTWINSTLGLESAPSPISDSMDLDGKAAKLDLSGAYPGMEDGLANTPPTWATAVHVYASQEAFGVDPRFGGQQFFRVTPNEGISLETLKREYDVTVEAGGGNTGNGACTDVQIFGDIPSQTITLTATSGGPNATFSVVGGTTPNFPDATSGGDYVSTNNVLRFTLSDGATPWIFGDSIELTIVNQDNTDGLLIATLAEPIARTELTIQPMAPWMNRHLEAYATAVADGKLLVLADQPAYSVGQWSFTQYSHVVEPVNSGSATTTPVVALWMEGRTIRRQDSRQVYRIVKCLDQDADGMLDALWIAQNFDPIKNEFTGVYVEATEEIGALIEGNRRDIVWTNNSNQFGVDFEHASPLNRLPVMPAGDSIVAVIKVGEFLWIFGAHNTFLLLQDPGALADQPLQAGAAYLNPRHIPELGLMGRRTWTSLGSGAAIILTRKGELVMLESSGQIQRLPVSDRLSALLTGWGYLADTRQIENSFMEYVKTGRDELIYLGLIAGGWNETGTGVGPGVRRLALDVWRDQEDDGPTGVSVDDTDFAIPWDNSEDARFWIDDTPLSNVEFEAFSPRPTGYDLEVEGDGISPSGGASADFTAADGKEWLIEKWFPANSGTNDDKVRCGWVASGPTVGFPEKTLTNARWPGSTWHQYKIAHQDNGYAYLRFRSANPLTASNDIANYIAVYIQSATFGSGIRMLTEEASKLLIHVFFAGPTGRTIPANTFQIALKDGGGGGVWGTSGDRAIIIDQPILSGQWNLLELDLPSSNTPYGPLYTDLDAVIRDGVYFEDVRLQLLLALSGAAYDSNGLIELYFTGGHQVRSYTTELTNRPKNPLSFEESYCLPSGNIMDAVALDRDFSTGIMINLQKPFISLGSECRFTCAGVRPSADCTPLVQQGGPAFMGDPNGFVNLCFDDKILTWGCPTGRSVFDYAGGTSDTFEIDRDFLGQIDSIGLPLDDDGNGLLAGLVCAKVPFAAFSEVEWRRIVSNTVDTVTIDAIWTTDPAAGDKLVVGPLAFLVHWAEMKFPRPAVARALLALADHAGTALEGGWSARFRPRLRFEQFAAIGTGGRVTNLDARTTDWFEINDLARSRNRRNVSGVAARALSYRLTVLQGDDAPVMLAGLGVEERL